MANFELHFCIWALIEALKIDNNLVDVDTSLIQICAYLLATTIIGIALAAFTDNKKRHPYVTSGRPIPAGVINCLAF